jgi:hypothetical protein
MSAMTGNTALFGTTITAVVNTTADGETGTATLYAKGTNESRADLALSGGNSSEIRNSTPGYPQGQSIAVDGSALTWATHNCWTSPG